MGHALLKYNKIKDVFLLILWTGLVIQLLVAAMLDIFLPISAYGQSGDFTEMHKEHERLGDLVKAARTEDRALLFDFIAKELSQSSSPGEKTTYDLVIDSRFVPGLALTSMEPREREEGLQQLSNRGPLSSFDLFALALAATSGGLDTGEIAPMFQDRQTTNSDPLFWSIIKAGLEKEDFFQDATLRFLNAGKFIGERPADLKLVLMKLRDQFDQRVRQVTAGLPIKMPLPLKEMLIEIEKLKKPSKKNSIFSDDNDPTQGEDKENNKRLDAISRSLRRIANKMALLIPEMDRAIGNLLLCRSVHFEPLRLE
ncbi:MAG: hypothetical protein C5B49_06880 [Bdellovibrio sp.]|nr:MAG: hypothetical protein C5B49_06880 [Bdellovibrio sp.]